MFSTFPRVALGVGAMLLFFLSVVSFSKCYAVPCESGCNNSVIAIKSTVCMIYDKANCGTLDRVVLDQGTSCGADVVPQVIVTWYSLTDLTQCTLKCNNEVANGTNQAGQASPLDLSSCTTCGIMNRKSCATE